MQNFDTFENLLAFKSYLTLVFFFLKNYILDNNLLRVDFLSAPQVIPKVLPQDVKRAENTTLNWKTQSLNSLRALLLQLSYRKKLCGPNKIPSASGSLAAHLAHLKATISGAI